MNVICVYGEKLAFIENVFFFLKKNMLVLYNKIKLFSSVLVGEREICQNYLIFPV